MKRMMFIGLLLLLHGAVYSQTLSRVKKLDQYWAEGKKKTYRFMIDAKEVGRLEAKMDDVRREGERRVYDIKENLSLDLTGQVEGFNLDVSPTISKTLVSEKC